MEPNINLVEIVDEQTKKVRTKSLDMSFNELLDMYKDNELIIDPDYQRLFRWSDEKQSQFIESMILEMPLPPIYVIEREQGVYELIDGLQRISSYLHFRGALKIQGCQELVEDPFLTLDGCDIVKELNGKKYTDLPTVIQIKLKRIFIRVEVIRHDSDQKLRYYMFKRLNTGGEILTDQEIRNCTIRLLDNKFNNFLIELSNNADFRNCINHLPDEKRKQKYDQELVLRFFTFKNNSGEYKHDVGDFMTSYMEKISDPNNNSYIFKYDEERTIFEKTFKILNSTLGEDAFARSNERGTLVESLSPYHYEAFTIGIQKWLNNIDETSCRDQEFFNKLKTIFISIKTDSSFKQLTTGGGKNTPRQLQNRVQFVEEQVGVLFS